MLKLTYKNLKCNYDWVVYTQKVSRNMQDIWDQYQTFIDETYNVWDEKCAGWDKWQIRNCRKKDQWPWRQSNVNYPKLIAERKKL